MGYSDDIRNVYKEDLPWNKLTGVKVLITGATGLIGGCLVDVLMNNEAINCDVYASGRNESRAKTRFEKYWYNPNFHFLKYDVLTPLKQDLSFDYIIHAASNASPNFFANNPVEVIKSNIIGVSNLVEYGLTHHMKRFLYISSGEIYGEGDGRIFNEDDSGFVNCAKPRACYPSSKRAAETLCVSYASEYAADIVIARPCHTYGPYFTESDNRVYAQFIRNIQQGEDIVLKSSGEQFRSWCYVVDCASAILYILLKGQCGEAYNIADSKSNISIKELAGIIARMGNKKVVVGQPNDEEKKGYNVVHKSVLSTAKISFLGWRPRVSLDKGLENTINESI